MNVYTIVLERIGTGEPSLSIVTRQDNEEAARAYAEAAIAQSPDLRIGEIHARPAPMMLLRGGSGPHGWGVNNGSAGKRPGLAPR